MFSNVPTTQPCHKFLWQWSRVFAIFRSRPGKIYLLTAWPATQIFRTPPLRNTTITVVLFSLFLPNSVRVICYLNIRLSFLMRGKLFLPVAVMKPNNSGEAFHLIQLLQHSVNKDHYTSRSNSWSLNVFLFSGTKVEKLIVLVTNDNSLCCISTEKLLLTPHPFFVRNSCTINSIMQKIC